MLRASSDDLVAGVSATRPLAHPEGGGRTGCWRSCRVSGALGGVVTER